MVPRLRTALFTPSNMSSSNGGINRSIRHITLAAMLLAVLYVQELLLSGLPNIQLTVVLIMVYAAVLPLSLSLPIVIGYVLLDNLLFGTISLIYTPAMFFSWMLLAIVAKLLSKKSFYAILGFAVLFAFLYGWSFIPANIMVQGITNFWPYLWADLPFELIMALSNFVSVLLLYRPLKSILKNLYEPSSSSLDLE